MSKAAKRERQRQNRTARREYEAAIEKRRRFWKSARGFIIILVPIAALFAFFALRSGGDNSSESGQKKSTTSTTVAGKTLPAPTGVAIDPSKTYTARLETTEGAIDIALDAKNAPTSVNNFVYLAKAGFYDGLRFNRAAKDFAIQAGSPSNTRAGGPGYTVKAELPTAPYEIGSVAWGKTGSDAPGTAGSQFFIGTGPDITSLPQQYGSLGKVVAGLDVAEKIMGYAPRSGDGPPTKDVTISTVTINES